VASPTQTLLPTRLLLRMEAQHPSHRVPGSTGSRNGNEERGTPIFNTIWNDEYTTSARPKLTWIEIQVNLG
jgi:hypothetical protein